MIRKYVNLRTFFNPEISLVDKIPKMKLELFFQSSSRRRGEQTVVTQLGPALCWTDSQGQDGHLAVLGCWGGLKKEIRVCGVTYSIKYATKPATRLRNLA